MAQGSGSGIGDPSHFDPLIKLQIWDAAGQVNSGQMNRPYIACAQKGRGRWLYCDRVHNKAKCQWCGHAWSDRMSHNPVLGTKRKNCKQRAQWAKWNFPKLGVRWPSFREVPQAPPGSTGPTRKKPEGRQTPQLSSTLATAWRDLPEDVQAKNHGSVTH